jgi:hypothetical protein
MTTFSDYGGEFFPDFGAPWSYPEFFSYVFFPFSCSFFLYFAAVDECLGTE